MSYEILEPFTYNWLQQALAAVGPALTDLPVDQARRLMVQGQGDTPTAPDLDLSLHHAPAMDFFIIRPRHANAPLPVIVFLHGGGWVLGDLQTHKRLVQDLAQRVGCAVVFPEYPRAPEAPFPAAVEDTYLFLLWLVQQAEALNLDTLRLVLAGDSSGGNLAAVLSVLAHRRAGPVIRHQVLLYPVTDCDLNRESYARFGSGFNLDSALMHWFWRQYVPDPEQRLDPRASPLHFPRCDMAGAAPAIVITAECDILRDEGEAYATRLTQAGVPTTLWRAEGTVHSFLLDNALAKSAPTTGALKLLENQLRDSLFHP